MKFIGRFTIRPESKGCLLLGGVVENTLLQPGRVYELQEILGELVVKDIGPCSVKTTMQDYGPGQSNPGVCWANSLNQIVECGAGSHLLTEEELQRRYQDISEV